MKKTEHIKPVIDERLELDYLTQTTSHDPISMRGHVIHGVQMKKIYFSSRNIASPNVSAIFPDLMSLHRRLPNKLSISHQNKITLNNPIYGVNAEGYNTLWEKIFNFIKYNQHLDSSVIDKLIRDTASVLYRIPLKRLITINSTNKLHCLWEPIISIDQKTKPIRLMGLSKVGNKHISMLSNKAILDAAGELACSVCNVVPVEKATMMCEILKSKVM